MRTGKEFLKLISEIYGKTTLSKDGFKKVKSVWDHWEKKGEIEELPTNFFKSLESGFFEDYKVLFDNICEFYKVKDAINFRVFFSILPSRDFNAFTNTTINGDAVIVVDEHIATALSDICITCLVFHNVNCLKKKKRTVSYIC